MVILLDFTQTWNDTWCAASLRGVAILTTLWQPSSAELRAPFACPARGTHMCLTQKYVSRVAMEDERYLYALLGVTVGCYAGIAAIVGLLFYWFNPAAASDCSFNVTIIVLALLVALVLGAASMHPAVSHKARSQDLPLHRSVIWSCQALQLEMFRGSTARYKLDIRAVWICMQATNGSLFPAAVVSLYCTYLAYSALQSEPHDYQCNSLGKQLSAASGSTLALGMVGYTFVDTHLPLLGHALLSEGSCRHCRRWARISHCWLLVCDAQSCTCRR